MSSILCPIKALSAANCSWVERRGTVRDAPDVGIMECNECFIVTHNQDLSHKVNYPTGTMKNWAEDFVSGDLPLLHGDVERRLDELKQLKDSFKIETLLDFGCGSGQMLEALQNHFKVYGLEPDSKDRALAKNFGCVWSSIEDSLQSKETFDVVTLFHVIEHLYNPFIELGRIFDLLKPGGLIVIETPNSQEILLTLYDCEAFQNFTYWSHHPVLYSIAALTQLLENIGFNVLTSKQCQRYDLSNHLFWLAQGEPGGHEKWSGLFSEQSKLGYANDLQKLGMADTLWVIGIKPS